MRRTLKFAPTFVLLACASAVSAQQMRWEPLSPSFGGNPGNTTLLMQGAQIQNKYLPKAKDPVTLTAEEQFFENLKVRLYSRATTQIVDDVFGGNLNDPVELPVDGGGTLRYEIIGSELVVTFTEQNKVSVFKVPMSF